MAKKKTQVSKDQYEQLVNEYVDSHTMSWAKSTRHAEKSRLLARTPEQAITMPAVDLYKFLEGQAMKPYAIKTVLIRVGDFRSWLSMKEENPLLTAKEGRAVQKFMKEHRNLFANVYSRKPAEVGFEEALNLIETLENEQVKLKAKQLLMSGMRFEESFNIKDGMIIGKGNKVRPLPKLRPSLRDVKFDLDKSTFNRHLTKIGLTPHMLRKIYATELANQKVDPFALAMRMGWSTLSTATSYIQGAELGEMDKILADFLEKKEKSRNGK